MAATIRIPTPLRKLTNEQETVEVESATVGAAIDELEGKFPGIKERLVGEDGEVRLNPRVWGGELVLVEPATQRRLAQTTGGHVGVPLRTLRRVWGPRAPVPICVFDRRLMNIDLSLGREGDRVRVVVTNRTGVALKTERLLLRNERELLEPRIVSLRDQEAHTYEFRVPSVKQQGLSARLLGCVARPNSSAERRGDAGKP